MRIALTLLLVLSAPLALYSGQVMFDLPRYLGSQWSDRTLFTGGGLWNLFLRLIAPIWLLCAIQVVMIWRRPRETGANTSRWPVVVVAALLFLLVLITALFVLVFWAWSQM
ncbi:hypothetical protein [Brevundimonas sp.]|uniref:hypothetical protein n=1 Tax=Brevundimonas sp. TaxID=1871086 RepID=UPI002B7442E3|nr:hypothetical protein [Brevundimonas sp.]HWQ86271.1 hypothetical protein [Brevundimonas sp.]